MAVIKTREIKEMTTQQFNELMDKLDLLNSNQLKTLKSQINHQLDKTSSPVLSSEEKDMLSKLFV
ncbi:MULTISPECIES: hypothetical protein [Vibrio]|uniref:Uncharacterized protein n=1 Tax=Vibrio rotiferianus TaxID=190895 RepID=A0A2K7SWM6_9VIBR|nr:MULTISPECIES: hypothetical protein [Vibrio]MDK9775993.1 hypothetical protein [Vibrio sp. D401a]MDK9805983.1 hypothetical protein [Vibrio sp. D406a]NOH47381.1 hypothetical protein [Vibrio rotiferianus]NOH68067.1 hypothetical protein [Vibrio rotiferianus]OHY94277.1 hypothetical protein BI375_16785 [Vibrio rotiferianus]